MSIPRKFASTFSDEISSYLKLRQSQGHQYLREGLYFSSLDRYLLAENIKEKELTASVVEGWLQSLPAGMSVNTKIVYISHYSGFAKYLHSLGFKAFVPERPIDDKSYAPYVFSSAEIGQIFSVADNQDSFRGSRFVNLHFPVLLRILYGCGLRLQEALNLQVGDADLGFGVLFVRKGKDNKDRLVPIDNSLYEILSRYISLYCKNTPKNMPLFPNDKGEPHTGVMFRFWFNRTLEAAGIEKLSLPRYSRNICPHCMRHTFAVHSFRNQDRAGADMYVASPFLSAYMGHYNILGTEKYLHMTAENSTDIIEKTMEYTSGLFPEVPQ